MRPSCLYEVVFFACLLFHSNPINAEHIIGGELNYTYLSGNNYIITLKLYRDCNSSGAGYDNPASVGIYSGNNLVQDLRLFSPVVDLVPPPILPGCILNPPNICVQSGVYTDTVTLPANPSGYHLVYTRCCRNNSIVNVQNASDEGTTYYAFIPPQVSINSNPMFNDFPPIYLCRGTPFYFDHSASDADGDSLVYEFFTPFSGASNLAPMPQPPDPPPFTSISWVSTYNAQNPLSSSPTINLNAQNGTLFVQPVFPGRYVVGIKVKEYRNGIFLSETLRDFQFNVVECNNSISSIPSQTTFCNGLTVSFGNTSINSNQYQWDFGVSGTNADTSSMAEPSFTYPQPGTYTITLIANNVSNGIVYCSDTSQSTFTVQPLLDADFTVPDAQCVNNNSFTLNAGGAFDPSATFQWIIETGNNPLVSNQQNVNNVIFTEDSTRIIRLIVSQFTCTDTVEKQIYIYPVPEPRIGDITKYCVGLNVDFQNLTSGENSYHWDFGVSGITSDTSVIIEPSYTFPDTGRYLITLNATDTNNCFNTYQDTFYVYPLLSPNIKPFNDSNYVNQCFDSNEFNFYAQGVFSQNTLFNWVFGPTANIENAQTADVMGIQYNQAGTYPVHLTMSENGCEKTVTDSVRIYNRPSINFTTNASVCYPYTVNVLNQSNADTPFLSFWDFGDGGTSTELNPVYTYNEAGDYFPKLKIITYSGCKDTLTLVLNNPVQFMPKPIPGLLINPAEVSIFDPKVSFTDTSSRNSYMLFSTGDGNFYAEKEINHTYKDTGTYRVVQVVKNEAGCADSLVYDVVVRPEFRLWVPNSFTPNNDLNNEIFKPVIIGGADYYLEIFDRWGKLIFMSNSVNQGWDGNMIQGGEALSGVYQYYLRCKNSDKIFVERKGLVVLIR